MKGEDENIGGENKEKVGNEDEENVGSEKEGSIGVEDGIMTMIEELRMCENGQKHSTMIPPYLLHITKKLNQLKAETLHLSCSYLFFQMSWLMVLKQICNVTFTKEDMLGYFPIHAENKPPKSHCLYTSALD